MAVCDRRSIFLPTAAALRSPAPKTCVVLSQPLPGLPGTEGAQVRAMAGVLPRSSGHRLPSCLG
jgi:hypothetical protein